MSFEHCHSCKSPTRHVGCHSDCPYYQADIAKYNAATGLTFEEAFGEVRA